MKYINPEELSLCDVFNCKYTIPLYQRNYAWREKQIEQFLEDIFDLSQSDTPQTKYYLGSLIVDKNKTDKNSYSVIDGQQRLTTLYLLFAYLKKKKADFNFFSQDSLSFEAREKSNKTLKALFDDTDISIQKENDDMYSKELLDGYSIIENYFKQKIEKNKSHDIIQNFIQTFSSITIIRTQVPENIDLNHYFEVMNTRGEQLEVHEIAKARILSRITDRFKREAAANIWDNCSQMDRYIQMTFTPSVRNNIFGEYWKSFDHKCFESIYHKMKTKQTKYIHYSLTEILDSDINPDVPDTKEIEEENLRFESIVSFPAFLLIVNECINKDDKEKDASLDDKRFLSILEDNWQSEEKALNFIYSLLKYRYLFDQYIIKRDYSENQEEGKWSLYSLKERDGKPYYYPTYKDSEKENILTLQSALRITYTSPKTMHWISVALNNKDKMLKALENYSCSKLKQADYHNSKGFALERIVFTYLDYILYRDRKILSYTRDLNLDGYQFMFRNSIEHFHPQNPLKEDQDDWKEITDDPLNSLGNLALITTSANSKFTNLDPLSKINEHPEIIKQSPKLMIMASFTTKDETGWTPDKVGEHTLAMLNLLDKEISSHSTVALRNVLPLLIVP